MIAGLGALAVSWLWRRSFFTRAQSAIYADADLKANARSCVLRVSNGGTAMLLAGDVEAPKKTRLVLGDAHVGADVLLASHHGSGTSSTAAFLRAVHPAGRRIPGRMAQRTDKRKPV